jgi:predicted negative regulator of RcsB-dependent stress response
VDHETKVALKNDKFVEATSHGLEWASENKRSVITTSAILLGVILLLVGSVIFYNYRSGQASIAFGAAMADYQTPLANPGEQVPPGTKTYSSVAERAKSANALFTAAANQYGMTPSGRLSRYFAGITAIEQGENASAEATLKDVASSWDRNLSNLANDALAQLYRQTGRDAQAIAIYNEMIAKPSDTVPAGLAQLHLAELYEIEKKPEEAKKIYAKLKDTDAKGPAGAIATQKLNPAPAGGGPQFQ